MSTDFWEGLRLKFLQLQEECERRLFAVWTAEPAPGTWQLRYWIGKDPSGFTERFEALAQQGAARLGCTEGGHAAVCFWLDRIKSDWPKSPTKSWVFSGPDDKEHLYSRDTVDICYWSAHYSDKCAADEMRPRAPGSDKQTNGHVEEGLVAAGAPVDKGPEIPDPGLEKRAMARSAWLDQKLTQHPDWCSDTDIAANRGPPTIRFSDTAAEPPVHEICTFAGRSPTHFGARLQTFQNRFFPEYIIPFHSTCSGEISNLMKSPEKLSNRHTEHHPS